MPGMANILVVDDDPFARQILADLLKLQDHQVVVCNDAAAALAALAEPKGQRRPDAVITDVRMPGMDGIDLARKIRSGLPDLPIALTSAEPDFNIHEEAVSRGLHVTVMLQKPIQSRAVQRVVQQLLAGTGTARATGLGHALGGGAPGVPTPRRGRLPPG